MSNFSLALIAFSIIFLISLFPFSASVILTSKVSGVITSNPVNSFTLISAPKCTPESLCPLQLQEAYGFSTIFSSGVNGSGQTIVIVEACGDPSLQSDLTSFDDQFGLSAPAKLNVTNIGGSPCSDSGWSVETSLDVEWAHVTAPGAAIAVLVAAVPNPRDIYATWAYALRNHIGNQISNSFGGPICYNGECDAQIGQGIGSCQSVLGTEGVDVSKLLSEAEIENVTVLAGSGDSGAWGLGTTQLETIPADCEGVLTVAGTTLLLNNSGGYLGETAWNESTGGGFTTNREPDYQKAAEIFDPFHSLAKPDVAALADPATGVYVFNNGTWGILGGTSLSCPLWAGFMADVNQLRANHSLSPAGFINPFLYSAVYGPNGASALYSLDFHEVTSGNNSPWSAGAGWNPDTGLGSFDVPDLANTLGTNPSA